MDDGLISDPLALGRELATARAGRSESLKTVATAAGVSAAYLQKLESGKVDSPSPRILRRLTNHLELSYPRLMELAGYEVPAKPVGHRGVLASSLDRAQLTETEERAVAAFIQHLVGQRQE